MASLLLSRAGGAPLRKRLLPLGAGLDEGCLLPPCRLEHGSMLCGLLPLHRRLSRSERSRLRSTVRSPPTPLGVLNGTPRRRLACLSARDAIGLLHELKFRASLLGMLPSISCRLPEHVHQCSRRACVRSRAGQTRSSLVGLLLAQHDIVGHPKHMLGGHILRRPRGSTMVLPTTTSSPQDWRPCVVADE